MSPAAAALLGDLVAETLRGPSARHAPVLLAAALADLSPTDPEESTDDV